jgi:hypothetical protein
VTLHDVLDWANLTLIVTGIFFAGVVWNKVNSLERQVNENSLDSLDIRIATVQEEMIRVRDRVEKLIDRITNNK